MDRPNTMYGDLMPSSLTDIEAIGSLSRETDDDSDENRNS